ncbi:MAG: hypothetical protein AAB640_00005, partial [Patescibacteria group bacterium]
MDPIIPQPETAITPEPHKHFLNKKFAITFVILILLGVGAYAGIWYWGNQRQSAVDTFEECVKAKDSKMLETYPEQCVTSDGQTFANPNQKVDSTETWKTYTNTKFCGGITGKLCPSGYSCKLDGNYPDAGGICIKIGVACTEEAKQCPDGSYVGRTGPNC